MSPRRRSYTLSFKRSAVELVMSGQSKHSVAQHLDVDRKCVQRWCMQYAALIEGCRTRRKVCKVKFLNPIKLFFLKVAWLGPTARYPALEYELRKFVIHKREEKL